MPSSTIIMEPEHGIYFEDGQGELRFQRATEIPKAPTQHLTNLLTIVPRDGNGPVLGRGLVPRPRPRLRKPSLSPLKKPRGFKRGSPSGNRGKPRGNGYSHLV